jgi:ElaB/YqjD/DUF883 family membrane-anchored ribosome-binding protein
MTKKELPEEADEPDAEQSPGGAALSAAAKQAQLALESAKAIVSGAHLDEVTAKASSLYREGRERIAANEELTQAAEQLSAAIRKNPLAAVGIAFSAGLLLALLTRG